MDETSQLMHALPRLEAAVARATAWAAESATDDQCDAAMREAALRHASMMHEELARFRRIFAARLAAELRPEEPQT